MDLKEANAKMMIATSDGDCEKLKDLVRQQDTSTMLLVMASRNKAPQKKSASATMHPMLLASASRGHYEELKFLLNRGDQGIEPSMNISKRFLDLGDAYFSSDDTELHRGRADVEKGIDVKSLLEGVTVEGNTVLHAVATSGEDQVYMKCANLIYSKDPSLMVKKNFNGDTPLHCAAKSMKPLMVSHLMSLIKRGDIVLPEQLLRELNENNETVLHEAVRVCDIQLVRDLLRADPELACYPKEGVSPMYLAVQMDMENIARVLYDESKDHIVSYLGPNSQNVLHAAAFRKPALTTMILEWDKNKLLTLRRDRDGSTPLHFAVASEEVFVEVFEANMAALFQPDNDGSYPIHVAASIDATYAIELFVERYPRSAGLCDGRGRTFLHVAILKKKIGAIMYACNSNPSTDWILNKQDIDGNTAMHYAVQAGLFPVFLRLFRNRAVDLNVTNKKGQTPVDIAKFNIPPGLFYNQNPEIIILKALEITNCRHGIGRSDYFHQKYEAHHRVNEGIEKEELEKVKESTQALCIGSVLISTVSFGAAFSLPGGYRQDDHPNPGTPTLGATYGLNAFLLANSGAFIFATISVAKIMISGSPYFGSPYFKLATRKRHSSFVFNLVGHSIRCLIAAFGIAMYLMFSKLSHGTAITVAIFSVFGLQRTIWGGQGCRYLALAIPLYRRKGLFYSFLLYLYQLFLYYLYIYWPFLVIFLGPVIMQTRIIAPLVDVVPPSPSQSPSPSPMFLVPT